MALDEARSIVKDFLHRKEATTSRSAKQNTTETKFYKQVKTRNNSESASVHQSAIFNLVKLYFVPKLLL